MTKSYKKDIQILMTILRNQNKIAETLKHFGCNQNDLDKNEIKERIKYCNQNADKKVER